MGNAKIRRVEIKVDNKGKPVVTSPKTFSIEPLQTATLEVQVGQNDGQLWLALGAYVPQGSGTHSALHYLK